MILIQKILLDREFIVKIENLDLQFWVQQICGCHYFDYTTIIVICIADYHHILWYRAR